MAIWTFPVLLTYPGTGGPGLNVWDLRTTADADPPGDPEVDGLSAIILQFYQDLGGSLFPQGYSAKFEGTATEVSSTPVAIQSPTWEALGSPDADMGPSANQMILTLRTTSATRRGRGRKFLGPVHVDTMQPDGTPTASALAALQGAGDSLVSSSEGFANGAIGVYSSVDQLFRDVVNVEARNYFAVLRSRRD